MKVSVDRSGRCCNPCWRAKCECGTWLTKHAFTAQDARDEAFYELTRRDGRQHLCDKAQLSLA